MKLQLVFPLVASLFGLLSSVCMLVLFVAGMANAKESHLQQSKMMMWGVVIVQAISLGIAIWLMTRTKYWSASAAGVFPFAVVIVLFIILVKLEW